MAFAGLSKRSLILFALFDLALALVLLLLFLAWNSSRQEQELRELGVTVYPQARELRPLALTDHRGDSFGKDQLGGQWTLLFFGYASCPDICPLTMAELDRFYDNLAGNERERLQVAMVSLDPARDDQDTLANYVTSFHEDFIGLRGSAAETRLVADQFFVAHERNPMAMAEHGDHGAEQAPQLSAQDPYLISHSGHVAVINPQGRFHAIIRPPVLARELLPAWSLLVD